MWKSDVKISTTKDAYDSLLNVASQSTKWLLDDASVKTVGNEVTLKWTNVGWYNNDPDSQFVLNYLRDNKYHFTFSRWDPETDDYETESSVKNEVRDIIEEYKESCKHRKIEDKTLEERGKSTRKDGCIWGEFDYGIVYLRDDAVDTLIKYIEELGG
jgi:hypothetical protein